jgi:hypothetical protein
LTAIFPWETSGATHPAIKADPTANLANQRARLSRILKRLRTGGALNRSKGLGWYNFMLKFCKNSSGAADNGHYSISDNNALNVSVWRTRFDLLGKRLVQGSFKFIGYISGHGQRTNFCGKHIQLYAASGIRLHGHNHFSRQGNGLLCDSSQKPDLTVTQLHLRVLHGHIILRLHFGSHD